MEGKILGAVMAARSTFNLVNEHLTDKDYSKEYQLVKDMVGGYYSRDPSADKADYEIILGLIESTVPNKKHQERLGALVKEAVQEVSSVTNVENMIIESRITVIGQKIALAMINKTDPTELIDEYSRLKEAKSLADLTTSGASILTHEDFFDVMSRRQEGGDLLRVYPLALNQFLNGGVGGGHHIITFARPEMGKTAFNSTIACGFANQGALGIYFLNEDRDEDVYIRLVCCLVGQPEQVVVSDYDRWHELAMQRGLANIMLVSLAPGTLAEIERYVEQYKPRWVIIDQLRNLSMKETNKVLQLEYAATGMRNIAKKHNVIVVSTTQAGDSAEGKRVLSMGDVDFSNTGIPAQADVLIGIGATIEDVQMGMRYASICKNKRGGGHAQVPLKIHTQISRYTDHNGN